MKHLCENLRLKASKLSTLNADIALDSATHRDLCLDQANTCHGRQRRNHAIKLKGLLHDWMGGGIADSEARINAGSR